MLVFEHGQRYGMGSIEASQLRTASLRPELRMTLKTNATAALSGEALPDLDTIRRRRTPVCRYTTSPCGQPPGSPGRAADPHPLILEHLRALRTDVAAMRDDVREVKSRLTRVERSIAAMYADKAELNDRHDRIVRRIERIERRLELTD